MLIPCNLYTKSVVCQPHDSRSRQKLERELLDIQSIMEDLSKQGERLSQVMKTLKPLPDSADQPFTETDMDTMLSQDISITQRPDSSQRSTQGQREPSQRASSLPPNQYSAAKSYEDLNDKGFFSHTSPVPDRKSQSTSRASTLPPTYGSPQGHATSGTPQGPYQGYPGSGPVKSSQGRSSSVGPSPGSGSYQSPSSSSRTSERSYQGQGQTSSKPYQDYGASPVHLREQDNYNKNVITKTTTTTVQRSAPTDPRDPRSKVDDRWRSPPGGSAIYQKPTSEVHPQRQSSSGFARWQSPEGSPQSPPDQRNQKASTVSMGNLPAFLFQNFFLCFKLKWLRM